MTSQFEPVDWYKSLDDAVIYNSILNRITGNAVVLGLDGTSMRRRVADSG